MKFKMRFTWLVASVVMLASPAAAQSTFTDTGAPVVQPTGYAMGDRQDQDEETNQVLAKTLDDHNQRLKAVEELAKQIAEDQEEQTFVERFEAIEGDVEDSLERIGDVRDSLPDYAKSGHGNNRMKVFGRVHVDYWGFLKDEDGIRALENGDDPEDAFGFRRMRIGVSGNVDDNMGYKIEAEFAAGNDFEFRDAYISFTNLPRLQTLIIGNQKRPYGLDHLNSSRYNVFLERPFIIEAVNEDARRLGIASYGFSRDEGWNWRFGVYNRDKVQDAGNYRGDNLQLEVTGRIARTAWWDAASDGRGYAHVGFAGSIGRASGFNPNNELRYRTRPEARSSQRWINTDFIDGAHYAYLAAVEGVLNVGPTQLVSEYQVVNVDRNGAFPGGTYDDAWFHGGYVYVSYFLTGEHIPWSRQSGTLGRVKPFENFFHVCDCEGFRQRGLGAWQVAARFSYADFNSVDINGGIGNAVTLGLNWHWNPYARMQFNYILGSIARNETAVEGGDYQIAGVRFMIDF